MNKCTKKIFFISLFFLKFCFLCFSQVSVDPTDEFYKYAQMWENRNLIHEVPPLRPYPFSKVKAILEEVIEVGEEQDKLIAQDIYERVTGRPWHIMVEGDFYLKSNRDENSDGSSSDTSVMFSLYPSVQGDFGFRNDFVSMGYKAGLALVSDTDTDFLPLYSNSQHDSIFDSSSVGPIDMYIDINSVIAVGTENLYFQGGIYRNGYSSFLNEGIVLNDTSYHSGNLSVTFLKNRFSYAQTFSMIGATKAYNGETSSLSPDKIMAFHTVGFEFLSWLKLSYYESIVYGNRTDLSYLMPVPYMVAQGIGGASDNLGMGLLIDIKPAPGILWETDIMADDFPMDDFFKLDFDSKYRIAVKTGLIYTPSNSFLEKLSFSYTAILPYTYSHWDYSSSEVASIKASTISYQNCTNAGIPIGSQYEPNSDVIRFSVDIKPAPRFTISMDTAYSRHGNICETLKTDEAITYLCADRGVYATDGSIYTHSMFADLGSSGGNHVKSAWNSMNWLNQNHVEYTLQTGVNLKYDLKTEKRGTRVTLNAGVSLEYIHNYGVGREMFPGGSLIPVYENNDETRDLIGFRTEEEGEIYALDGSEAKEIVKKYKDDWASQLVNRLDFYFNFGVTIRF